MRTELSIRAKNELEGFDAITATLIRGWIIRHLLPLDNPKTTGTSLGGSKRWQYRIGDYRLLCRVSEKKIVILAITHGHELPSKASWMVPKSPTDISL